MLAPAKPSPPAVPSDREISASPSAAWHSRPCVARAGVERLAARAASTSLFRNVGGNLDRNHLVRVDDRLAALDLVDIVHALDHFTPDGILAIEERRVGKAD